MYTFSSSFRRCSDNVYRKNFLKTRLLASRNYFNSVRLYFYSQTVVFKNNSKWVKKKKKKSMVTFCSVIIYGDLRVKQIINTIHAFFSLYIYIIHCSWRLISIRQRFVFVPTVVLFILLLSSHRVSEGPI